MRNGNVTVVAGLALEVIVMLVLFQTVLPALAHGGDSYELRWSTINDGGGPYELIGTICQPNAAYNSGKEFFGKFMSPK